MTLKRYYVVDTGYLDELFRIDGYRNEEHHARIFERWKREHERNCIFFVPAPVAFEVCNHVAHVRGNNHALVQKVVESIRSGLSDTPKLFVVPRGEGDSVLRVLELLESLEHFEQKFAYAGVGLTDAAVIGQAHRLKEKYAAFGKVHIWSKDKRTKANEPDSEDNPLHFD